MAPSPSPGSVFSSSLLRYKYEQWSFVSITAGGRKANGLRIPFIQRIANFTLSRQFTQAIESKQTAEQLALKTQRDLERVKRLYDKK